MMGSLLQALFSSVSPKTLRRDFLREPTEQGLLHPSMEQGVLQLPTKKQMKGLMVLWMQASRKTTWGDTMVSRTAAENSRG